MITRENGLRYTVAIIKELNEEAYNKENFNKDRQVLETLLKTIKMWNKEEDLDLVVKECNKELRALGISPRDIIITNEDKRFILKYL